MKYFICNIHWKNRGDEAAIRAMAESIYDRDQEAEIVIVDNGIDKPEQIKQYFKDKKMIVLQEYPARKNYLELIIPYITKGKVVFGKQAKQFCKHMMESDVVIHGPGGPSIGELYKRGESRYITRLRLALRFGKKIFFYAPSAGPFETKFANIFRRSLYKKASGIVVREEQSKKYLEQLGINGVIVATDSALQKEIDKEKYKKKFQEMTDVIQFVGDGKKVIGLTITDLKWHAVYKDNHELADRINTTFVEFLRYLDKIGYKALFIPQKFESTSLDYSYMCDVAKRAGTENIMVMPDTYCSYMQQYVISLLHMVVGMRYHSNIFAYKMKTPFVSIAYEHKMTGFMKIIGREENCIWVNDLNIDLLKEKFEKIDSNYPQEKQVLEKEYENVIERAKITTNQLFDIL